jgi:exopolysaccharide biosynthesis protein
MTKNVSKCMWGVTKPCALNLEFTIKKMLNTEQEKYLGDIVTSDTRIDKNIKMRQDKGIGISNQSLKRYPLEWAFCSAHLYSLMASCSTQKQYTK